MLIITQSPLEQRVSLQAHLSSYLKDRDHSFSSHRADTPCVKHKLQPTPLHRADKGHAVQETGAPLPNPREPSRFRRVYCTFCAHLGVEHHPHTQLSLGHGSDITCKDFGHHLKD